jgi:uncharacterized protein (TIGR01370 family)
MRFCYFLALSTLFTSSLFASSLPTSSPFVVYYGDTEPASAFQMFDTLVFDSDSHPLLDSLKGKKTLGYLSLGEVEKERWYFQTVKEENLLLGENPNWPGSYFVDLRNPSFQKLVIEKLIPYVLFQGFEGIFLDTLDNAEYLEAKYPGMKEAAFQLLAKIRTNWPKTPIMLNRGYYLLDKGANLVDMALAESLMADWDFEKKKYVLVPQDQVLQQRRMLEEAKKKNSNLTLFSLDYWDPEDQKTVDQIYEEQKKHGFIPYVSTLALDRVFHR